MVGIRSVDARLLELGRSLRATRRQVSRTLEIPAALPNILGGMRVGVTLAVVGAIVGEWAGADKGLGVLINLARGSLFDIPLMFATLADDRAGRDRRCTSSSSSSSAGSSAPLTIDPFRHRRSPCPRSCPVVASRRRSLIVAAGRCAAPAGASSSLRPLASDHAVARVRAASATTA